MSRRTSLLVDQQAALSNAVVRATAVRVPGSRWGPPESPRQMPPSPCAFGFWFTVMNHWLVEFSVSVAKRLAGS
jgi:hypothetical protein